MNSRSWGTSIVAVLSLYSIASAQVTERNSQVYLTVYGSLTRWKGEGALIGGGLQFESGISRHVGVFGDLALAAVAAGCETLVGARCPSAYWHVLGGIRLYAARPSARLRPYISAAAGSMRLGNSNRLMRIEGGAIIQSGKAVLQLALYFGRTYTRSGPQLWGVLGGVRLGL